MALLEPPPFHFPSLPRLNPLKSTQNSLKDSLFSQRKDAQRKSVSPMVRAESIPETWHEKDSNFGRTVLPDVVVKRKRNMFWGRKWNILDIAILCVVAAMHVLCVLASSTFSWGAFSVAVGLCIITGLLGITLSFHRNLSHRSFKLPKWLEYLFAYYGTLALH